MPEAIYPDLIIMKKIIILTALLSPLVLTACSPEKIEEFVFRKTMERELIDLCGKKDPACIETVKTQTASCMVQSNWKQYVDSGENDEQELVRFSEAFYGCLVDENGQPYFDPFLFSD